MSIRVLSKYGKLLLAILLMCCVSGCKEPLYTKLSEQDANEMMSILMTNGIDIEKKVNKKDQTLSLLVEKEQLPSAFTLLKQAGFPREPYKKMIDIFDKQGLISSPMEERVRFIYALTQEVQETLAQIDGVITARVHLVLPDNNPFSDNITPSSAAVFIKSVPSSHLEEIKSEIKFIVEKSIEGLQYEQISVVMLPSNIHEDLKNNTVWSNFFGIRLSQDSVNSFQYLIGIFVIILLIAVLVIAYLIFKILKNNVVDEIENISQSEPLRNENIIPIKDKTVASIVGAKNK